MKIYASLSIATLVAAVFSTSAYAAGDARKNVMAKLPQSGGANCAAIRSPGWITHKEHKFGNTKNWESFGVRLGAGADVEIRPGHWRNGACNRHTFKWKSAGKVPSNNLDNFWINIGAL